MVLGARCLPPRGGFLRPLLSPASPPPLPACPMLPVVRLSLPDRHLYVVCLPQNLSFTNVGTSSHSTLSRIFPSAWKKAGAQQALPNTQRKTGSGQLVLPAGQAQPVSTLPSAKKPAGPPAGNYSHHALAPSVPASTTWALPCTPRSDTRTERG